MIDFKLPVRQNAFRGGGLRLTGIEAWGGQQVQLVWFLANVEGVDASDVFKRVWEVEADSVQRNRIPGPANPFLSVASSRKDTVDLVVQVLPGRCDLIITSASQDESVLGHLFDVETALNDVFDRLDRSGGVGQDVFRISVVATVMKPVDQYAEGAAEFFGSLGFDPEIPDASDLMFQLNSKKLVGGVLANRIIQFSVAGLQAFAVGQGNMSVTSISFAARRQYDFNTIPDGTLLEQARQLPIFRALANELLTAAASGKLESLRT